MSSLFDSFRRTIEALPANAVRKAIVLEGRMLAEDVATGREDPLGEAASILAFCRFIEAVDSAKPSTVVG